MLHDWWFTTNTLLFKQVKYFFFVRKLVGELPTERGDLGKTMATVSKFPWCHWKLWHVCVSRHCYIIHCPRGDLLPICYRYVHQNVQARFFYHPKGLNSLYKSFKKICCFFFWQVSWQDPIDLVISVMLRRQSQLGLSWLLLLPR